MKVVIDGKDWSPVMDVVIPEFVKNYGQNSHTIDWDYFKFRVKEVAKSKGLMDWKDRGEWINWKVLVAKQRWAFRAVYEDDVPRKGFSTMSQYYILQHNYK